MIGRFNCLITLYRMISEKKASNAPITFEEIVMVIISTLIRHCWYQLLVIRQFTCNRTVHASNSCLSDWMVENHHLCPVQKTSGYNPVIESLAEGF